jgi:hypothetical protein
MVLILLLLWQEPAVGKGFELLHLHVLVTPPPDTCVQKHAAVLAAGVRCECGAGWCVLPAVT